MLKMESNLQITSHDDIKKIILLGKVGHGKSSFGNFLLDSNKFLVGDDMESCTQIVEGCRGVLRGDKDTQIEIVDTPGLDDDENKPHILDKANEMEFVNAFVYVLESEPARFTGSDKSIFLWLESSFGTGFWKHFMIKKRTKSTGKGMEKWIKKLNEYFPHSKSYKIEILECESAPDSKDDITLEAVMRFNEKIKSLEMLYLRRAIPHAESRSIQTNKEIAEKTQIRNNLPLRFGGQKEENFQLMESACTMVKQPISIEEFLVVCNPLLEMFKNGHAHMNNLKDLAFRLGLPDRFDPLKVSLEDVSMDSKARVLMKEWYLANGKSKATIGALCEILDDIRLGAVAEDIMENSGGILVRKRRSPETVTACQTTVKHLRQNNDKPSFWEVTGSSQT